MAGGGQDVDQLSDATLWHSAAEGDVEGFVAIYQRYAGDVLTQCARHLGDQHAAEDAAAVVFFEAWRRRESVRLVDGAIRPWLLVTALNVCRNQRRASRRYRDHLSMLPSQDLVMGDIADDVVSAAEQDRARSELSRALGLLRSGDRDVVLLCLGSGLTYDEAAAVLQIPVGTVRSRLSRSRQRLRESISQDIAGRERRVENDSLEIGENQ